VCVGTICKDPFAEPVETDCGHVFCHGCITTWLTSHSKESCPLCSQALTIEACRPGEHAIREGPVAQSRGGGDPQPMHVNDEGQRCRRLHIGDTSALFGCFIVVALPFSHSLDPPSPVYP